MKYTPLFIALACMLPLGASAANVQYTVTSDQNVVFSVVATDFLPNLPAPYNGPEWTFNPSSAVINSCIITACIGAFLVEQGQTTDFDTYNAFQPSYDGLVFDLPVTQFGTTTLGSFTFSISSTDAPATYAPEPQTWALLLAVLPISLIWRLRRVKRLGRFRS